MFKQHPNLTDSLNSGLPARKTNSRNTGAMIRPDIPGNATEFMSDEAIRSRAFQMWEQAGMPEGDGVMFWLDAERELNVG